MASTRVVTTRSREDSPVAVGEAAAVLREGGLVGFATETVYGLGALATIPEAVRRLREVKSRPDGPFSVHVASPGDVRRYVRTVPLRAAWLMDRLWPGPVTLLLDTGGELADAELQGVGGLYEELTRDGIIGLRCPDEPVATAMLAAVDGPVIAPSANPAGQPSPRNAEEALAGLDGQMDLLLDSGPTACGQDSTIVRFDGKDWRVLRQGACSREELRRAMRRRILFVCTGNTCRSPMAAGIAKMLLAEHFGCRVGQLRSEGIEVSSAGLMAGGEMRATPEALSAARALGASISHHRSRMLTAEMVQSADVVFGMTRRHIAEAQTLTGPDGPTVELLDDQDIPDPMGGGENIYTITAETILRALRRRISEGTL